MNTEAPGDIAAGIVATPLLAELDEREARVEKRASKLGRDASELGQSKQQLEKRSTELERLVRDARDKAEAATADGTFMWMSHEKIEPELADPYIAALPEAERAEIEAVYGEDGEAQVQAGRKDRLPEPARGHEPRQETCRPQPER